MTEIFSHESFPCCFLLACTSNMLLIHQHLISHIWIALTAPRNLCVPVLKIARDSNWVENCNYSCSGSLVGVAVSARFSEDAQGQRTCFGATRCLPGWGGDRAAAAGLRSPEARKGGESGSERGTAPRAASSGQREGPCESWWDAVGSLEEMASSCSPQGTSREKHHLNPGEI